MCQLLGVSAGGYYAWRKRQPSNRRKADVLLTEKIRAIYHRSDNTYGSPRIHAELRDQGIRVGCKRVARLMRAAGLRGVSRRKGPRTTIRKPDARPAPDLVNRNFSANRPDELWVADITYSVPGVHDKQRCFNEPRVYLKYKDEMYLRRYQVVLVSEPERQ